MRRIRVDAHPFKVKAGQPVSLVHFRRYQNKDTFEVIPAEITRVGRKYIYAIPQNASSFTRETKLDRETYSEEDVIFNGGYYLFENEAAFAAAFELSRRRVIIDEFINRYFQSCDDAVVNQIYDAIPEAIRTRLEQMANE